MNADKIYCVLAGYDAQTEKYLSGLQQSLYGRGFSGTQTKDIFMHITLGTFSPSDEEMLIEKIRSAATDFAPFDVTFNHIGIFGGSKVLFIAPDPNVQLLSLKECFGPSDNWTPHTTMLIDESETVFRAVPIVSEGFKAFRGQVTSLNLYEFWPTRKVFSRPLNAENEG